MFHGRDRLGIAGFDLFAFAVADRLATVALAGVNPHREGGRLAILDTRPPRLSCRSRVDERATAVAAIMPLPLAGRLVATRRRPVRDKLPPGPLVMVRER